MISKRLKPLKQVIEENNYKKLECSVIGDGNTIIAPEMHIYFGSIIEVLEPHDDNDNNYDYMSIHHFKHKPDQIWWWKKNWFEVQLFPNFLSKEEFQI